MNYLTAVKIKEQSAFVSQNLPADIASPFCIQKGRFDVLMKSFDQKATTSLVSLLPRELWPEICHYASCFATSHKCTTIGPQLCQCVEAAFFENRLAPEEMILPDAIHSAMRGLPPATLELLSRNIVLTGGTSLLPGIVVSRRESRKKEKRESKKRVLPFPYLLFSSFPFPLQTIQSPEQHHLLCRNDYRQNLQKDRTPFRSASLAQEIQH